MAAYPTEEEIYPVPGLPHIAPELRETGNEVVLAPDDNLRHW